MNHLHNRTYVVYTDASLNLMHPKSTVLPRPLNFQWATVPSHQTKKSRIFCCVPSKSCPPVEGPRVAKTRRQPQTP